jgi:hypothetical protein
MLRGQQHAVTDRRHRFVRFEEIRDVALQDVALQVFAHAACAMSARQ